MGDRGMEKINSLIQNMMNIDKNKTKEQHEKELNYIGLSMLKKFVKRNDYKNATFVHKKSGKKYHITVWRKGFVYLQWECYGVGFSSRLSIKMNIKELKERFEVIP